MQNRCYEENYRSHHIVHIVKTHQRFLYRIYKFAYIYTKYLDNITQYNLTVNVISFQLYSAHYTIEKKSHLKNVGPIGL